MRVFSAERVLLLISLLGTPTLALTADNLRFSGALVAEPCTLRVDDENINIDFGSVIEKYLYINGRTLGKPLVLHLDDCDTSLGNMVKMSFSGSESSTLNGLLAISAGSLANGIAIGIETTQGNPIALNSASHNQGLINGNNIISLQAYVQGEPTAIANQTITPGIFSASATFLLEYE